MADLLVAMRLMVQMEARRNDLKRAFPDTFRESMTLAVKAVRARSAETGENEVQASLALAKEATAAGQDLAALFYAVAPVEMAGL